MQAMNMYAFTHVKHIESKNILKIAKSAGHETPKNEAFV